MDNNPGSSRNRWRLRSGITTDDIEAFAQRYRNSRDEKTAIKDAYIKGCGSMNYIMEHVMCTTVADEPRIRQIIEEMIEQKTVPAFAKFTNDDSEERESRKRKANDEALEAKRIRQDMGTMAQRRQQNFTQFLDYLEEKYKDDDSTCDNDYHTEEDESSEDDSEDSDTNDSTGKRRRCE